MERIEIAATLRNHLAEAGLNIDSDSSSPFIHVTSVELPHIRVNVSVHEDIKSHYGVIEKKLSVAVDCYGIKSKRFPQKKDESFSWAKIVETAKELLAEAEENARRSERQRTGYERSRADVAELEKVYGAYGRARIEAGPHGIKFSTSGITREQAEILLEAARKAGLLNS